MRSCGCGNAVSHGSVVTFVFEPPKDGDGVAVSDEGTCVITLLDKKVPLLSCGTARSDGITDGQVACFDARSIFAVQSCFLHKGWAPFIGPSDFVQLARLQLRRFLE